MSEIILDVRDLKKYFNTKKGIVQAVDGVSFTIEKGKTLGIVGESGCGKSTTGRAILRLIEPTSGEVIYKGRDITQIDKREMKKLRKDMQIVFQDPFSSINPRMTVGQLIAEPLIINKVFKGKNSSELIENSVLEMMKTVGLENRLYNSFPHELDGGRRQRIGIARALILQPELIICDEPVSALDVSIQAQILNLMKELQVKFGLTYIFITHNLSVVNHIADDIAVMYLGSLIEKAPVDEMFSNPLHPYTKALLSSIPVPEIRENNVRPTLNGEVTSPINLPNECRFCSRCDCTSQACREKIPVLKEVTTDHFVACCMYE